MAPSWRRPERHLFTGIVTFPVDSRFEMIVLHLVLVLPRLEGEVAARLVLSRHDGSLHEMGVEDLAVPAEMGKIGEAFFGRRAVYEEALSGLEPLIGAEGVPGAPRKEAAT
jgi:cytochrome b pre-mRNA-processing protein 3